MGQNVFPVYLVVEQVETVARLALRLLVQLPLKHPDLYWCFQAHRQSPLLSFFKSTSEARVLPSAGITRPQRYRDPLRLPSLAVILTTTLEAQPPPFPDLPQLPRPPSLHAVLTTPVDRTGACRFLPCSRGLPRLTGGSASTTSLLRNTCARCCCVLCVSHGLNWNEFISKLAGLPLQFFLEPLLSLCIPSFPDAF